VTESHSPFFIGVALLAAGVVIYFAAVTKAA